MADVSRLAPPRRKAAVGRMDKRIILQDRGINATRPGETEFTLSFNRANETWASLETRAGGVFFDGVNTQQKSTHVFTIRYRAEVTAQNALFYDGETYNIDDVENLEQRDEWLRLRCTRLGNKNIVVNEA